MKYCFGPVPSRRLGLSFGVDLLPAKTCNLNCVYCEIGVTEKYVCDRREYIPTDLIKRELEETILNKKICFDCLTFTASGEPTLHTGIGELLAFARTLTPKPLVVLTNGTLLWMEEVRDALCKADLVLPSLDAAIASSFRKVNRPAKCVDLQKVIDGLAKFRKEFTGKLWLETLLVKGINHSQEDIEALKEAIEKIDPHRIQLNTVARPPAEPWAKPLSSIEMEEIKEALGPKAEVIVDFKKKMRQGFQPVLEAEVMEMLTRRPLTLDDIGNVTGLGPKIMKGVMEKIRRQGLVEVEYFNGKPFFVPVQRPSNHQTGRPNETKR